MKKFIDVELNRINYHSDQNSNSVHRASLLVPKFHDISTQISFLNHFRVKRGYPEVALKITAVSGSGAYIRSTMWKITDERVYTYNLEDIFSDLNIATYIVEFFSIKNLFIPYPAVMINHLFDSGINVVHAYNRVLNDVFEDDEINSLSTMESSIDILDDHSNPFINIHAGAKNFKSKLIIYLINKDLSENVELNVDLNRFCHKMIFLRPLFDKFVKGSVIKVKVRSQEMFYGRMLTGQYLNGGISGNHTYYDSSSFNEYFNNGFSYATYPFFNSKNNRLIFYPNMSKSELDISIEYPSYSEKKIKKVEIGKYSDSNLQSLEININEILGGDIQPFSSYRVICRADKIPMRVNHQLVLGTLAHPELSIGINFSLKNSSVFSPANKKTFTWGQVLVSSRLESYIGISTNTLGEAIEKLVIDFYNEHGLFKTMNLEISEFSSIQINGKDIYDGDLTREVHNIWYVVKSDSPNIKALSFHYDKTSSITSGEHAF